MRSTTPPAWVVIDASIFIASMVATTAPGTTVSPSDTARVTTPANGAATWPGSSGSARSVTGTSTATLRSRICSGRIWPLSVVMTVRIPRSSASPMASSPT